MLYEFVLKKKFWCYEENSCFCCKPKYKQVAPVLWSALCNNYFSEINVLIIHRPLNFCQVAYTGNINFKMLFTCWILALFYRTFYPIPNAVDQASAWTQTILYFVAYFIVRMKKSLKMLCLYLLGQNCLHLSFYPYLSSETFSCKYEKLLNIVIHACKNVTEKMNLLKMSGPQIRLCLFTFRSIVSKQLNS